MSNQFYFKQFSLAQEHNLFQFDTEIGPYQLLPLQTREDLVAVVIKGPFAFSKAPALLEPHHQIV